MTRTEYEGRLFIDGEFREARSSRRYDVISPADESVVGSAADAGTEDVYDAVTAARRAADETTWGTDHKFRRHCLEQLQVALRNEATEFQKLVTAEAGVASSVIVTHVDRMIDGMDFWNDLTTSFQWEEDLGPYELLGMQSDRRVRYEPYGVVGAVTPWNAPFMTAIWKVTHSMATGNTVVLKSAPDTPLTAAKMAQVISESTDVPQGVVNMISSEDKAIAGDALTGDPRVDMFHFTGSPGVGQRIQERAAIGIRHVVLELGGKSANVLLPDADLDMASALGVGMCMSSSGQGCALPTRMIVHSDIYDEVLQRL
ncbi:MAG: aldehyde dehydrogenase family protein, partial [Mycobacterium sp.]